jgi:hypothetical protein
MKLHKLSHLLFFFILLFPASGIIILGCSSSVFARKPGTLSESKLNDIQQGMSGGAIINEKGYLVGINSKLILNWQKLTLIGGLLIVSKKRLS